MKNRLLKLTTILGVLVTFVAFNSCKKSETPEAPGDKTGQEAPVAPGEGPSAEGVADTAQVKPGAEENCTYSTDPKSIQLHWIAYKYTEKTPVKGSFNTANVSGPTSAKSLAELAKGLMMDIDGASIESGDPGRNATVKDFFFAKFNPPFKLQAVVKNLTGSDTQGNLMIEVNMNGVTKEVPFEYTATSEGEITAKGGINLMNWDLKNAFDSIHQACEELHTGKDGVSKTWDVVDLELTGKFTKSCP